MRVNPPERLSLFGLAVFSLPMLIMQAIEVPWRTYLPSLFATKLGLSLGAVGGLLMAVRVFDTVVEPVVAWASDRFSTRWGQRRPWMAAGAPLIMLGTVGVFFAWPWTNFASLIAACLVLHLGYVMLVTPHGGWALELARDGAERLRITGGKIWFAVAGTIAILLLPSALERGFGVALEGQVAALGVLLIVLCPLVVPLVLWVTPEPNLPRGDSAHLSNPLRLYAGLLRLPRMGPVLLMHMLAGFAQAATGAVFLFLVDGALGLKGWGSTLLLLQTAAMLVTTPIWSKLGAGFDRRVLLALNYGWQLVTAPLLLLLPVGMLAPAIGFLALRSLFAGVDFLVLRTMVADITRDAAVSGVSCGASCHSICNATLRLAMGGGAWFSLSLLSTVGVDGAALSETLGDNAGLIVRAAYVLPPMLAGGLGLLVLAASVSNRAGGLSRIAAESDTAPPLGLGIREKRAMIQPGATFKDNLQQLPAIDGVQRIDLVDPRGEVVASIENQPGKQGSLAIYQYLKQQFGGLDAKAAEHGLAVFGEHTADARNRPGAHPNIDRLLAVAEGGAPLRIEVIAA